MASGGTGQQGNGPALVLRESDVKICDLCGWLNLDSNRECFICGWHGRFERKPETIHAAVEEAIQRYGSLELRHLTDLRTYRHTTSRYPGEGFRGWLARIWSRLRG